MNHLWGSQVAFQHQVARRKSWSSPNTFATCPCRWAERRNAWEGPWPILAIEHQPEKHNNDIFYVYIEICLFELDGFPQWRRKSGGGVLLLAKTRRVNYYCLLTPQRQASAFLLVVSRVSHHLKLGVFLGDCLICFVCVARNWATGIWTQIEAWRTKNLWLKFVCGKNGRSGTWNAKIWRKRDK